MKRLNEAAHLRARIVRPHNGADGGQVSAGAEGADIASDAEDMNTGSRHLIERVLNAVEQLQREGIERRPGEHQRGDGSRKLQPDCSGHDGVLKLIQRLERKSGLRFDMNASTPSRDSAVS